MKKVNVAILCGGKSAEHEVALQSARNILETIDKNKYTITMIGIDKQGKWHQLNIQQPFLNQYDPKNIALNLEADAEINYPINTLLQQVDVVFPVLHGPNGEDGSIQGLLQFFNLPFVGAGVLGSAIGMDKDVTKRLLRDADINISEFISLKKTADIDTTAIINSIGLPCFVKPANMGSSIGISKVTTVAELNTAIKHAFSFDGKIIIEKAIVGREIEIAVLGNEQPTASIAGEIIPKKGFYSYAAKYLEADGAILKIPAELPTAILETMQTIAIKAFKTLCCKGMARVDFFLTENHSIYLNEINTIPGFTDISMYPNLWKHSDMSYPELIDRLLSLAMT